MAAVFEAKYIGTRGGWRDMSRTELEIEPESLKGLSGLLQVSAPAAPTAENFSQHKPDAKADSVTTKGKHDDNTVWHSPNRRLRYSHKIAHLPPGHCGPTPPRALATTARSLLGTVAAEPPNC
jgi:hypothetical protein